MLNGSNSKSRLPKDLRLSCKISVEQGRPQYLGTKSVPGLVIWKIASS